MCPQVIPGFWKCPRCEIVDDIYFALRHTGSVGIGPIVDMGDFNVASGVSKSVENRVALCKQCGERADYYEEQKIYSDQEKLKHSKSELLVLPFIALIIVLIFIAVFIWFPNSWPAGIRLVALIFLAFGFLGGAVQFNEELKKYYKYKK
jgi:hypothetical protein